MADVDTDPMVALIAAELFKHRLVLGDDGRAACACKWWVAPLLDSLHRLHQAEHILAATLMATAQVHGENLAEATTDLRAQLADCQQQLLGT